MSENRRATIVLRLLNKFYPRVSVPLKHRNLFTLLVSVALSAQTTDVNVNKATRKIYPKYNKPEHFIKLGRKKIEKLIRSTGFFKRKAKSVYLLSKQLVEKHGGKVPGNFEDLEKLHGVGHKTASVVMSQGFGHPAFPVDTHIHRLAARWGLSNDSTVERTEKDLKAVYPKETWNRRHLQIIFFGREYCPARHHDLTECPICSWTATKRRIAYEQGR